jgi:hypothetical protein
MIRFITFLKWLWIFISLFGAAAFTYEILYGRKMSPWPFVFMTFFGITMAIMNHQRLIKLRLQKNSEPKNEDLKPRA